MELPSLQLLIFASENGWLEDEISFGMAYVEVRTVSFREGKIKNSIVVPHPGALSNVFCLFKMS